MRDVLLLSVRPVYVARLIAGSKNVELRRTVPLVRPGMGVLIYASAPDMEMAASAVAVKVDVGSVSALWRRVGAGAGVSKEEYVDYFNGVDTAVAISLEQVSALAKPIGLRELRRRWPWFRPPQSYRYVRAEIRQSGRRLVSLEPRA